MRFEIHSFGTRLVQTKFERMAMSAKQTRPAFIQSADYLFQMTDEMFNTQGARGGAPWKPLTTGWAIRKALAGHDPRILHMKLALRRSVTKRGTKGSILRYTQNTLEYGTSLPYAARHQFGVPGKTPKRQFIKVLPKDRQALSKIMRDHLMSVWERGRRLNA